MSEESASKKENESASSSFKVGKILVAVDGSENSKRAARAAAHLARTFHAELVVFMAAAMPSMFPASAGALEEYFEQEEGEAKRVTEEIVSSLGADEVEARGRIGRAETSVVQTITRAATDENADLILVGTSGLGGFKKLLLGSVSSGVVANAHCSVLVVR